MFSPTKVIEEKLEATNELLRQLLGEVKRMNDNIEKIEKENRQHYAERKNERHPRHHS